MALPAFAHVGLPTVSGVLACLLLLGCLCTALTRALARHAVRLQLIDNPNHRSSHQVPTPRLGGVVFVPLFLLGLASSAWAGAGPTPLVVTAWLAVLLLWVVGVLEDRHHLPIKTRLLTHLLAFGACNAVWLWGLPLQAGAAMGLGLVLTFLGVWWVNLFNFMDGADGLAASQGVFMAGAVGVLLLVVAPPSPEVLTALLTCGALVAVLLGFLKLNWNPASVFMGDCGSTGLALMLWVLFLLLLQISTDHAAYALVLPVVFVCDATLTLLLRMVQGKAFWQAHREHAYQHLMHRWGWPHAKVAKALWAYNVLVVLPVAALVQRWVQQGAQVQAWAVVVGVYAVTSAVVLLIKHASPKTNSLG